MSEFQGLPAFAGYFGMGLGFVALFLLCFLHFTPQRELQLIRQGNMAASIALAGALIGFCLPLAGAIAHSVSYLDLGAWGLIALLAQFAAYLLTRLLLPGLPARIERNEQSAAIISAALHIGVGLLNAAAMAY